MELGIHNTARRKVENGASIIVTGNFFEDENNWDFIKTLQVLFIINYLLKFSIILLIESFTALASIQ